jgi:hypothetical protein
VSLRTFWVSATKKDHFVAKTKANDSKILKKAAVLANSQAIETQVA